jgi:hypothetical protein
MAPLRAITPLAALSEQIKGRCRVQRIPNEPVGGSVGSGACDTGG